MSAQARELLRLLRLPSNRTCADCDAPLTDSTNVWASVTHGVFICVNCVSIHRKVGVHISRVRSVNHDVWADEEIAMMKLTNGNAVFNQTYERYIPRSMHKPTPDASWEERETWIRGKYEYKAFMIPLYSQEDRKGGKKRHARDYSISHKTNLPMRLVDYFVVVGLDEPNPVLLSPRPTDFLVSRPPPIAALSSESFSASFSSVKTTQGGGASTPNHSRSTPNSPAVGPGAEHSQGGFPATATSAPCTPLTITSTVPTPSSTTPVVKPEHVRLSCCVTDHYPDEDAYVEDGPDGCPMPEHVSQFVFPDGFMLHFDEQPPAFFSFVLTNVNGVRSYGCALRVTEDVDTLPDPTATRAAIASAFEGTGMDVPPWVHPTASTHHSNGHHTPVTLLHAQGFYVPKTLVVLSHYPFFDIFREVLLEVYRISISSAPLPIERYIANFVCEVPLPPQGQIEIKYALPDRTLTVARPPKNKLPLTSVSFRPLFTLLNVDNILLVFGLLLTETRVALCSSKYALLTPVSEALLSLLFPFVWQGAFIPVMPVGMADILDAPVPFFVGLHRRYLDTTKPAHRPAGVVFVDLDNDEVILGADEDRGDPRQRPRLPEREMHKLRQKLVEFGSVAYNPRCPEVENADLAFPNNEHHLPISSFATEQGMTQKNQSTPTSVMASFGFSKLTRGRADAPGKPGAKGGGGAHLANATLNMSILSAGNNEGMPDNFSADQIRAAFLRFFVSILRSYQSFIQAPSPDAPPAPGAEPFNKEAFLKESSHLDAANDTLATVISSQMFERFIEERIANPDHPQIKFFDESIVAKLNRSKTQLKKVETNFLDNNADMITETFNPPPPSNWGLPDTGEGYTYPCFPRLRPEMYGNIRKPRRLFKFPEQQRTGSKAVNAAHMLQRSLSVLEKAASPGASPPHTPRAAGKLATLQKRSVMSPRVVRGFNRFKAVWRMHRCRSQYKDARWAQGVIAKQWRAYASGRLARGRFVERRTKVICIQKVMRGHLTRKAIRRRHGAAVKLQLWLKMVVTRRAYLRRLHAIRRVQALFRGRRARQTYLTIRDLVILVQATVRGWLERRHAAKERQQRLSQLRRHIFYLWKLAHTPLIYRSKFWMLFNGTGFLHIAIHEDEAIKLWRDLGFLTNERLEIGNHVGVDKSSSQRSSQPDAVTATATPKTRLERRPSQARGPSPRLLAAASFITFFRQVEGILQECEAVRSRGPGSDPAMLKASTGTRPPPTGHGAYSPPIFGLTPKGSATQAKEAVKRSCALDISLRYAAVVDTKHLNVAAERLEAERAQLYWGMKQAQNAAEGAARDSFFAMFGLQHGKRRKRHLCQLVWQDLDHAEQSSEVVLATLGATDSSKDWVQAKLDQRIRSDLLTTVQACLLSIHEQKSSYRRIRKRYIRTRRQLQESTARASQLLHGPTHHRRQMSSLNSLGSYDGGVTSPTGTSVTSLPLPPIAASPDTIVERVFRLNDTSMSVELKTIHEHGSGKGGRLRGVPRTSSASITPSPVTGGPVGFSLEAMQPGSGAAGAAGGVTVGQQL